MNRLRALWKWLVALACVVALAIALLMAEPPDVPALVWLSNSLIGLWTRPFLSNASYGSTLLLVVQATVLLVVLWISSKLASRIVRVRFLDRTQLEEGRKFALQRILPIRCSSSARSPACMRSAWTWAASPCSAGLSESAWDLASRPSPRTLPRG